MKFSAHSTHPFPHCNFHSFFPCSISIHLNYVAIREVPFPSTTPFFWSSFFLSSLYNSILTNSEFQSFMVPSKLWLLLACQCRRCASCAHTHCTGPCSKNTGDQSSVRLTVMFKKSGCVLKVLWLLFFFTFWLITAWRGFMSSLVMSVWIYLSLKEGHTTGVKKPFFQKQWLQKVPFKFTGVALKCFLLISKGGDWWRTAKPEILPWERTWQDLLNQKTTIVPSTLVSNSAFRLGRYQAVSNFPLYFTQSFSSMHRSMWSSASHALDEAALQAGFAEPEFDKQKLSILLAWLDSVTGSVALKFYFTSWKVHFTDGSKLWSSVELCTKHLRCTLEMSFSSFSSQILQNYSVSREESPMFAFYELDSPAPYSVCCLLIILFLLCRLFPALVYPPLCFTFLMVWSLVLPLLSPSMLFCTLVLIFFCLWDYTFITDLSGAWKEGICLDSQNEENILSKYSPMLIIWARRRKSFKALSSNSSFLWPELIISVSGTLLSFADATAVVMQWEWCIAVWHHNLW